jgi:hypothetical protein
VFFVRGTFAWLGKNIPGPDPIKPTNDIPARATE